MSGETVDTSRTYLSTFRPGRVFVLCVSALLLGVCGLAAYAMQPAFQARYGGGTADFYRVRAPQSDVPTGVAGVLAQLTQDLQDGWGKLRQQQVSSGNTLQHISKLALELRDDVITLKELQQQGQQTGVNNSSNQLTQLTQAVRDGFSQLKQQQQQLQGQVQQLQKQQQQLQKQQEQLAPQQLSAQQKELHANFTWPSDGADPNGNSCRNGFLTSPRTVFWGYQNDTAMSLTEVVHAGGGCKAQQHPGGKLLLLLLHGSGLA
jgi:hypothetical protein